MRQIQVGDLVAVYAQGYNGQVCEVTDISYADNSDIAVLEINGADYVSAECVELVETSLNSN